MGFTAKQKAIAIAPKFTSLFSVLGSGFIIEEVLRDKKKLGTTFHRILLGMSTCDLLASSWFFMTSWPIPAGTEGVYGAVGNEQTCTVQGFFSQFSLATVMYNASLSIYYLLKIGYGWHNDRIKRRVEPIMHAFVIAIGVGTSTAGVRLNLYNNDSWECWISPLPLDCNESWKNGGETNCERGDNASLYRWTLYYAPLWTAISVVTLAMITVYRGVRMQERKVERHEMTPHSRKISRRVANQGYWYCGAFYITWFFPTITRLTQLLTGQTPYGLIILTAMFVPIQGFFNCIVYVHPRTREYERLHGLIHSVGSSWRSLNLSSFKNGSAEGQRRSRNSVSPVNIGRERSTVSVRSSGMNFLLGSIYAARRDLEQHRSGSGHSFESNESTSSDEARVRECCRQLEASRMTTDEPPVSLCAEGYDNQIFSEGLRNSALFASSDRMAADETHESLCAEGYDHQICSEGLRNSALFASSLSFHDVYEDEPKDIEMCSFETEEKTTIDEEIKRKYRRKPISLDVPRKKFVIRRTITAPI